MIGYVGAILLSLCCIPQAIFSLTNGNSHGVDHMFIWTWFLGEAFMLIHLVNTGNVFGPLFLNYLVNFVCTSIILYYKYFERK